jgi:hypothetical protein
LCFFQEVDRVGLTTDRFKRQRQRHQPFVIEFIGVWSSVSIAWWN